MNADTDQPLPVVVLIGDSIRLGYAPIVSRLLHPHAHAHAHARVLSPEPNGGDSARVLEHLDDWIVRERPDVVHFNCGLHDLKRDRATGAYQVPLDRYERNLRRIVDRLRRETRAALVFASTTPILDDRHARRGADFDRYEADVARYNVVALEVMREAGVPVDDLHRVVAEAEGGPEGVLSGDGTHYTPEGYALLAAAVADCVTRALRVSRYRPSPAPAAGPEAAAAYRADEEARDRAVPARYRDVPGGVFRPPADAPAWAAARPDVLAKVEASLGDLPPRPSPPRARRVAFEQRDGYTLERVALDNGADGEISASGPRDTIMRGDVRCGQPPGLSGSPRRP